MSLYNHLEGLFIYFYKSLLLLFFLFFLPVLNNEGESAWGLYNSLSEPLQGIIGKYTLHYE